MKFRQLQLVNKFKQLLRYVGSPHIYRHIMRPKCDMAEKVFLILISQNYTLTVLISKYKNLKSQM